MRRAHLSELSVKSSADATVNREMRPDVPVAGNPL